MVDKLLESKSAPIVPQVWQIVWFGQEEADFEKLSEMGENVTTPAPRQNRWFGSLPISVGPLSHTGFAKTDQNQTFISQLRNRLILVPDHGHRVWKIESVKPIVRSRSPEAE